MTEGADPALGATYRSALKSMIARTPERHPLVIGLVAPLGTKTERVARGVEAAAAHYDYGFKSIRLSSLLESVSNAPWGDLPARGQTGYYDRRQDAGDRLRKDASDSALAALAVLELAQMRREKPSSTIYLLDSFKHPDEVKLLEHIYGESFWLFAVVTDPDSRRDDLAERLARAQASFDDPRAEAERLIRRDEDDETRSHGQHVRRVFDRAHAYIPMARGYDVDESIGRLFEGIFGKPFHTPTVDEEAMSLAYEASLRSAAMGRQVGAVLLPLAGATYVVGTNEVPKPGGGQFWSGDSPDYRDFSLDDDPNPLFMSRMLQELFIRMSQRGWLDESKALRSGDELLRMANEKDTDGESLLAGTRAASVIEFTRCLHAEQAAIANAARQGVSTTGARLYTTTFPCHECAKFIVGAGIVQVVYIEPYPKSMVRHLYRDLIDMRATLTEARDEAGLLAGKVAFSPFIGFSPQRYNLVFVASERREGIEPRQFNPAKSTPRGQAWSENAVIEKEVSATKAISGLLLELYTTESAVAESNNPEPTTEAGAVTTTALHHGAPSTVESA